MMLIQKRCRQPRNPLAPALLLVLLLVAQLVGLSTHAAAHLQLQPHSGSAESLLYGQVSVQHCSLSASAGLQCHTHKPVLCEQGGAHPCGTPSSEHSDCGLCQMASAGMITTGSATNLVLFTGRKDDNPPGPPHFVAAENFHQYLSRAPPQVAGSDRSC